MNSAELCYIYIQKKLDNQQEVHDLPFSIVNGSMFKFGFGENLLFICLEGKIKCFFLRMFWSPPVASQTISSLSFFYLQIWCEPRKLNKDVSVIFFIWMNIWIRPLFACHEGWNFTPVHEIILDFCFTKTGDLFQKSTEIFHLKLQYLLFRQSIK